MYFWLLFFTLLISETHHFNTSVPNEKPIWAQNVVLFLNVIKYFFKAFYSVASLGKQ